ncbi:EI24 domain-containing protein [Dactylosporangium roseum]|uniref:EI24 domain-containing protein n=1 Tax=Dactylosporangium roseum TaxID=47989 RepID=A0ABY5Z5G4_9ACTN|nr:EI24 domain-containing protein [Dactylosporangium roseum]
MGQTRSTWDEFFAGFRLLGRGFARYGRSPGLLLLGMIPAVISLVLLGVAWFFLILFIDDLAAAVTWFADDWSSTWRGVVRFGAGAGILAVGVLLSIVSYTALTLLIGDPFYEVISERIEADLGGTPGETDLPWYRTFFKNLADSIRLILLGVAFAVPLFLLGFVPVVGQTVVPVLNAIIGGWLIAVELTGIPFNRRGLRLKDRRQLLRAHRPLALGFGIPVFLLLLIPLAAIVVVPAAVAGSTLLTRRVLGLSTEEQRHAPDTVVP